MDIAAALQIVLDLARQNTLDEDQVAGSPELEDEKERQETAIKIVEDMAVNQFGDD